MPLRRGRLPLPGSLLSREDNEGLFCRPALFLGFERLGCEALKELKQDVEVNENPSNVCMGMAMPSAISAPAKLRSRRDTLCARALFAHRFVHHTLFPS